MEEYPPSALPFPSSRWRLRTGFAMWLGYVTSKLVACALYWPKNLTFCQHFMCMPSSFTCNGLCLQPSSAMLWAPIFTFWAAWFGFVGVSYSFCPSVLSYRVLSCVQRFHGVYRRFKKNKLLFYAFKIHKGEQVCIWTREVSWCLPDKFRSIDLPATVSYFIFLRIFAQWHGKISPYLVVWQDGRQTYNAEARVLLGQYTLSI